MSLQPELPFFIHENSLKVYREKVGPTLRGRKLQVLEAIKALGGSATIFEIGQHLNLPLNCFSGRLTDLKKSGHIIDSGKKEHHGNEFTIYQLTNKNENK